MNRALTGRDHVADDREDQRDETAAAYPLQATECDELEHVLRSTAECRPDQEGGRSLQLLELRAAEMWTFVHRDPAADRPAKLTQSVHTTDWVADTPGRCDREDGCAGALPGCRRNRASERDCGDRRSDEVTPRPRNAGALLRKASAVRRTMRYTEFVTRCSLGIGRGRADLTERHRFPAGSKPGSVHSCAFERAGRMLSPAHDLETTQ